MSDMSDGATGRQLDPISTEVIRHSLDTIVDEMHASIRRTAYSVVVKDSLDFSSALLDANGRLLATAIGIPTLLGSMGPALRSCLAKWGTEVFPGDVLLTNHPYMDNAHTNDVTVFVPVFDEVQELIGFAGAVCHHADVGGRVPGSASATNQSIFEEGVLYPAVKLEERGQPSRSVYDIMWANVRHPWQNRGDLRAQLAATRVGERRLQRLVTRYGSEFFAATGNALIEYTLRRTRQAIEAMPDGVYTADGAIDDDGLTMGVPVPIRVTVVIAGDRMSVDFTGTARQIAGGMNCPIATTRSVVQYGLKCLIGDDIPFNEGAVIPVDIIAPEGTLVNPRFPAAVGDRHHTSMIMANVLAEALSEILPERGSAGWFCGVPATIVDATSNKTGESSVFLSLLGGGAGASLKADGADAVDAHMSNCALPPAEVIESTYPLRVERCALVEDSGGAGRMRGGLGMRVDFRNVSESALAFRVEVLQSSAATAARGLDGGCSGAPSSVWRIRDGVQLQMAPKSSFDVAAGEIVSVRGGGGGGMGSPAQRLPAAVAGDVASGRVSREAAELLYGRTGDQN
jgi:N-methylhydantoinase B